MISNPIELLVQRMNTAFFIGADPETVVLHRSVKVSNGHGGYTLSPPLPLPAQQAKLIPQASRRQPVTQTLNGSVADANDVLMMGYDADVEAGDTFELNGNTYTVMLVHEKHDYETMAEVSLRGES